MRSHGIGELASQSARLSGNLLGTSSDRVRTAAMDQPTACEAVPSVCSACEGQRRSFRTSLPPPPPPSSSFSFSSSSSSSASLLAASPRWPQKLDIAATPPVSSASLLLGALSDSYRRLQLRYPFCALGLHVSDAFVTSSFASVNPCRAESAASKTATSATTRTTTTTRRTTTTTTTTTTSLQQRWRLSAKSWWIALCCALLLLSMTSEAQAKTCVVPRFTKLPPALVFRTASYPSSTPRLTCSAYPASTRVVFLQRRASEEFPTTVSQAEARQSATYRVEPSALHSKSDFYCRLGTEFGHLLSRPFRIVTAEIFPYSPTEPSHEVSFYKGNIAQVQCSIPRSQPPATVQFLKDGLVVGHSDKYLEARLPGGTWVALLIKEFSSSDIGNYSCKAQNPESLLEVESRAITTLSLRQASSPFGVRFHKTYPFHTISHQKVTVREGDNVTLYCLPEGAPIPSVKWFRQSGSSGGLPKSTTRFPDFGAMRIDNVRPEDASTYTCTAQQGDTMLNKAFELRVQQRLKIMKPPQDLKIARVGSVAELSCEAEGGKQPIKIQWYFNAQPINVDLDPNYVVDVKTVGYGISRTVLKVKSVTTDLLGIYQCVATTSNEWASASAAIALKGDVIQRGNEQPKYKTVVFGVGTTASLSCSMNEEEKALYSVAWFKDNRLINSQKKGGQMSRFMSTIIPPSTFINVLMAEEGDAGIYTCRYYNKQSKALVKECSVQLIISDTSTQPETPKEPDVRQPPGSSGKETPDCPPGLPGCPARPSPKEDPTSSRRRTGGSKRRPTSGLVAPHVKLYLDNLAVTVSWNYSGPGEVEYYTLQYRKRDNRPKHTLDNLPGHNWSKATSVGAAQQLRQEEITLAGSPLQPGFTYRFRVLAKMKLPDARRLRSKWSKEADFSNILSEKPRLLRPHPVSPTEVRLQWNYEGEAGLRMDEFVVNFRARIDGRMDGYHSRVVRGGDQRSVIFDGLQPDTMYQFVIYGVSNSPQRRITLFSNTQVVTTPPCTDPMFCAVSTTAKPSADDPSRKEKTNRETFLILAGMAVFLIFVLATLIALCLWKQRRDKRRMRASALQATLNGTQLDSNYKNPKFLIPGTNSASSQLLLANLGDGNNTTAAAVWQQQQQHHQQLLQQQQHQQQMFQQRFGAGQHPNGGLRLNVNPEAASLMMNYDERFAALPPPPPPLGATGFYGNGTLRRDSRQDKVDAESLCAARMADDPLYATRLHPAYAVTSPIGLGYTLPGLPAPLGGPPGRFSPYAVASPQGGVGCDGAESVYSYFSQQEAGTQHLEGGAPPPGMSRTVDRPRHHRRKRRRPTNHACSQSGMESGSETGVPQMKDMAVNTDMSSSDAVYESSIQASTTASPPPRMGALMMGGGTLGYPGTVSTPSAFKSPPGGPEVPPPPSLPLPGPALSTPVTSVASSSASSGVTAPGYHTLSRRAPNLFLDPPRVRDYTEYGVAVSPGPAAANGGVVPAV